MATSVVFTKNSARVPRGHHPPPGPRGFPVVGSALGFHTDPNGFLLRLTQRFGDVSRFTVGRQQFFLLNHPDLVRDLLVTRGRALRKGRLIERAKRFLGEGLITSEEPLHMDQRRKIQPHFDGAHLTRFAARAGDHLQRLLSRWSHGATLDLDVEMRGLTMTIVANSLFDTDIDEDATGVGQALRLLERGYPLLMLPHWIERLPVPRLRRIRAARRYLDETIYRLIVERRNAPGEDVISRLTSAGSCTFQTERNDEQVRDEVMTLFVAGQETTANALTWALYLVSTHRDVHAALTTELDTVLGQRSPTPEDLPHLEYTDMVFSETLRLYPPVGRMGRRSTRDLTIASHTIPAGSVVFVSPYAMHRDARYFPNPRVFDPMRWLPDRRAQRPKFSYFPYGAGTRMCVGARYAQMIGVLSLAAILQRWQFAPRDGHPVIPRKLMTMAPRFGVPVTVTRRA